jgi:hypothetical protein
MYLIMRRTDCSLCSSDIAAEAVTLPLCCESISTERVYLLFLAYDKTRVRFLLALANKKLSGHELLEGAPGAQFYSIR